MVDFQQRDTTRGLDDEDEATSDPETDDDAEEATPGATLRDDEEENHEEAHHSHDIQTVGAAIVTVSSTRTRAEDTAGDAIQSAFEKNDDTVVTRDVIRDDYDNVQSAVDALVGREDVDVVVTTGGTGVSPDDVTVEAVRPLFEKELPGFGELFRRRSVEQIGTKVVGSRATAGIADGVPVFCLPGSEAAARLGSEEIIVDQAAHLAGLAQR